jgi:hypothetical protein
MLAASADLPRPAFARLSPAQHAGIAVDKIKRPHAQRFAEDALDADRSALWSEDKPPQEPEAEPEQ